MKHTFLAAAAWVSGIALIAVQPTTAAQIDKFTGNAKPELATDAKNAAGAIVDAWAMTYPKTTAGVQVTSGFTSFGGSPKFIWDLQSGTTLAGPVAMTHNFGSALNVGQDVSLNYGNSARDSTVFNNPVGIKLTDSSGFTQLDFRLITSSTTAGAYSYYDSGSGTYHTLTGLTFGSNLDAFATGVLRLKLDVALTGTNAFGTTYLATIDATPLNASAFSINFSGTFTSAVNQIQLYNDSRSAGTDAFSANLTIAPEPASAGIAAMLGSLAMLKRRRQAR